MGARRALVATTAAFVLTSGPAAAATWFASPSGSGAAPCAAANPCSLTTAITNAPADTEVVVAAGNYSVNGPVANSATLTVHGPASGALPVITQSSQTDSALTVGAGSTVSRLKLVKPTGSFPVISGLGGTVFDQLIIETDVSGASGAQLSDGDILRDSVVTASPAATTVTGVLAETPAQKTVELRNDTIEVPGTGGIAVSAKSPCFIPDFMTFTCMAGSATTMDLRNVLARGAAADLQATYALFPTAPAVINVDHSNYRPGHVDAQTGAGVINDKGANQSSDPALTADFHELATSPTVDAGTADPLNGAADLDGMFRAFGPPDIGAYELPESPVLTLQPVTGTTARSATIAGTVDLRGVPGSDHFVYGTTASYGSTAPATPLPVSSTTSALPVRAALTGLHPNTTYHYALTATNAAGTQTTTDATFTTPAVPPPPPPPPPPRLSSLAETNATFRVTAAITPITATTSAARHPGGTEFLFRLDRAAQVRIVITTAAFGRRSHGRCVAPNRRLRHSPRCTRTILVRTLTRSAHAGLNSAPFTGRFLHGALRPGRYRATFTARNAGGASRPHSLGFSIVRR